MFTRMVIVLSLVSACGPEMVGAGSGDGDGDGDGESDGSGDGDVDGSDGDDSSTADDGEALTHGTVSFRFRRSESGPDPSSVDTVSITMTYRDCLAAFYDANPAMRQDGPEGEAIFGGSELGGEGWRDRLCEAAGCTIIEIDQQLDPVMQLTVIYELAGSIDDATLAFGPLPTNETAGCGDPIVRADVGSIKGFDVSGAELWTASAVEPLEAVTNQSGALAVSRP